MLNHRKTIKTHYNNCYNTVSVCGEGAGWGGHRSHSGVCVVFTPGDSVAQLIELAFTMCWMRAKYLLSESASVSHFQQ